MLQLPSFETCDFLYRLIFELEKKQSGHYKKYLSSLDEAIYKLAERCNIIWRNIPTTNQPTLKKDYQPTEKFLTDLFASKLYINVLRYDSKYKDKYLDFARNYNPDLKGKADFQIKKIY